MKKWIAFCALLLTGANLLAQTAAPAFIDLQKSFPIPSEAMKRKQDTLQKQFAAKGLQWPAKYMFIRSFKYDSQLEVWVKSKLKEPFQLRPNDK